MLEKSTYSIDLKRRVAVLPGGPIAWGSSSTQQPAIDSLSTLAAETNATNTQPQGIISWQTPFEINVVVWNTSTPSGQYTVYTMQNDGTNTFTYTASSNAMCIQIRQAGTYYLDNIRMYRTYEDTIFVRGYEVDMAYRYGFNSMERDNEIKEIDNSPLKNAVATVESRANADKSGNSYIVLPDDDDRLDESFGASTLGFLIYVSDSRKNTDTGSHEIGHALN